MYVNHKYVVQWYSVMRLFWQISDMLKALSI